MKIYARRGRVILIDDKDFDKITMKISVSYARKRTKDYAYIRSPHSKKRISLHRFLMNPPTGMVIDHINGNGLDNRRINLRICTHKENCRYRTKLQANNTSGFHGIRRRGNGWEARINVGDGIRKYAGFSKNKEIAAKMYDEAAKKYHGEFATLNFKPIDKTYSRVSK